jgi:hypothetical protein
MDEGARERALARARLMQACRTDPIGAIPDLDEDIYDERVVDGFRAMKAALRQQQEECRRVRLRASVAIAIAIAALLFTIVSAVSGSEVGTRPGVTSENQVAQGSYAARKALWKTTRVESSVFSRLAYDRNTSTARAYFLTGAVYDYFNVPEHVYADWIRSSSKGQFFHAHIRERYSYERVQ